jgi:hypothetical protein
MKWKNASRDRLPQDKQDVLIAVQGIYYHTVYHADDKAFVVKYDNGQRFEITNQGEPVYWAEIDGPSE